MARILGIEIAGSNVSSGAIKEAVGDLRAFDQATTKASASVERLAAQRSNLKMLAVAYQDVADSAVKGSDVQVIAAQKAAEAQNRLAAQVKASSAEMTAASTKAKKASLGVSSLGGSAKNAEGMVSKLSGSMALWLGAPALGAGLASAIHGTQQFNAAMEVLHTQAGASQTEVKRMTSALLNMASSVGTTPDELAAGLYHIESTGLRGAKALDILKVAAQGAKLGNANLEDVTNALNAVVVSGIKGAQDYTQAMGVLNATVGTGDMRMQDLADAMGTGLPAKAAVYGVSLRDVSAALAVFGDNNIRGAEAGTQLGSALRLLAAPSKAASKVLGDVGISSTELADDLRNQGLVATIQDLKDHMEKMGLSASQQGEVLTRAFGGKQAGGIMILIDQLSRLQQKVDENGRAASGFGSSWSAYTKQSQFATQQFTAALDVLRVHVGTALLPTFTSATKSLTAWVDKENQSGQLTKELKSGIADLTTGLHLAKDAIGLVDHVTGSFEHTMELLIALKAGSWAVGLASDVQKLIGSRAALTGIAGADVEASGLLGSLGKLKALGPIGVTVALSLIPDNSKGQQALNGIGLGALGRLPILGGLMQQSGALGNDIRGWLGMSTVGSSGSKNLSPLAAQERLQEEAAAGFAAGATRQPLSQVMNDLSSMGAGKQKMMALAQAALGTPYLWGGNGPGGFDCSGLVQWAFANGLNVNIPRTTYGQAQKGQQVNPNAAQVGDVVFTNYGEGGNAGPGHEGLIVGYKNGQPIIEAAPHTGSKVQTYTGFGAFTGGAKFTVRDLLATMAGTAATGLTGGSSTGNAAIDSLLNGSSGKMKKPAITTGSALLGGALQNAIAHAQDEVTQSSGAVAGKWLKVELAQLDLAKKKLAGMDATGKQKKAIDAETRNIDSQIANVNKQITANLKSQADAIKSNAKQAISSARSNIGSAFSQIINDARTAFEQSTSDYITNTLGPQFYQGLSNPLESQLAGMQAADTAQSLQDALTQAQASGDAASIAQAQRAIDENNLAIKATALRAQEDTDYAAAVKKYQDDRQLQEDRMTSALKGLATGVEDGTQKLSGPGGLSDTLASFGVTTSSIATDDMGALSTATVALAQVFASEAAALAGVGSASARAAATAANAAAAKLADPNYAQHVASFTGSGYSSGFLGRAGIGTGGAIPMLATGGDIRSAGLAYLHPGERVLPASVVNSPTNGGGAISITIVAPNYVGDKRDLAAAIKSPQVREAVATAVITASRAGHIRQGDIRP